MTARPRTVGPHRDSETHGHEVAAREHDQRQAARIVATRASGPDDCRDLLQMLGLAGIVGLPVVDPPPRH